MPRAFPKGPSTPNTEFIEGKAATILTHRAYMEYVSANAAKSGKSVSPMVGKVARTPLAAFF